MGESVILLPYHIHGFHWVAIARREIQGHVLFLYADDLNCPSTEEMVKI
jgi:hypothetical protein